MLLKNALSSVLQASEIVVPRIFRPSDSLLYTEHNLQSQEETNKHKNKMDNKQMVFFLLSRPGFCTWQNATLKLFFSWCSNTQHTSYIPKKQTILGLRNMQEKLENISDSWRLNGSKKAVLLIKKALLDYLGHHQMHIFYWGFSFPTAFPQQRRQPFLPYLQHIFAIFYHVISCNFLT